MASAGDIPTREALAAIALLREEFSDLKIRFVNVVTRSSCSPTKLQRIGAHAKENFRDMQIACRHHVYGQASTWQESFDGAGLINSERAEKGG
ncbi:MAG: hypothetical protein ACJ74Y_15900 [Bryobacteraceae bacterium]